MNVLLGSLKILMAGKSRDLVQIPPRTRQIGQAQVAQRVS
jgi:hypothetical protein